MSYTIIEKTGAGHEWLDQRRRFIGASEAPVVCGLSPYMTEHDLWATKVGGRVTDDDIDLFYFAHRLEAPIAERAAQKWPDEFGSLTESPGLIVWDQHPALACTPDYVLGDGVPFQIKTVGPYARAAWGRAETQTDVPDGYRIQVIQEAAILGKDHGYIEPLFGLADLARPIRIDVDEEFLAWYIERAEAWHDRHIVQGTEPDFTVGDDLVQRWPGNKGQEIQATPEIAAAARAAAEWRAGPRKAMEDEDARRKHELQTFMQDATELVDPETGDVLATWRPRASAPVIDLAGLRRAHPGIVAEFTRPGKPSRALLFKSQKGDK